MKRPQTGRSLLVASVMLCATVASAEVIMYNGFPRTSDATYSQGFTASGMRPSGVSSMMKNDVKYSTLQLPACFAESSYILPLRGGEDDASLYIADVSKVEGGIFSSGTSGAKVLKLTDNCQSRTGALHFRLLMRIEQGAMDAMTAADENTPYPTLNNSQSCGLFWTVPDYYRACGDNASIRLNKGLELSADDNTGSTSISVHFSRGLTFAFFKESTDVVSLKAFVWGAEETGTSKAKILTLVESVTAGETYVCSAKIDIGLAGGKDVIRAQAQPVSTYDPTLPWPGTPYPQAAIAKLIGGGGSSTLNAHLVVMGNNKCLGKVQVDEICLTTKAEEAVVLDAAKVETGVVIAYEGFPCSGVWNAYSADEIDLSGMQDLSSHVVCGFSDKKWGMFLAKNAPKVFGAGAALSLPALYTANGIGATDGTSIGFKANTKQPLMMYRTFTSGLLDLTAGTRLNMRFLMSVTSAALTSLAKGPDVNGTLLEGTAGVNVNVNYLGAGLAALPSPEQKIEFNNTQAPALCPRDNTCLCAFVKGSDSKVGLYLNLRTKGTDAPTSYKLADVDASVGGTYLCFVTIEVGTGADGKERIQAFGVNVDDVRDRRVEHWAPADANKTNAIEHELISTTAYPTHLMVGGSDCSASFKFDEFALSFGDWYPLVWAKYPKQGAVLIFK